MRERLPWLLIGLFFVLICWRIVDVQLLPDPRVVAQAGQQYWAQVAISTGRGAIEDRNGFPLALSSPSISLFIDPLYWNPSRAKELSPLLTPEEIREISRPLEGRFRWLARKLEPERADKIMHLSLPGVFAIKEMKRTYSGGELAAHVIGFVDIDDRGLAGIEYEWDRVLYSPPQAKILLRNAAGNLLDVLPSHLMSHGRGSVQLTIDARIQYIVSKHLARGAERHKAQWGTVICMDPRDGAVLAMASWPTFDPNNRNELAFPELTRNNAINRVYEPGSTFKPVVMSLALEQGHVSPKREFNCRGEIKVADGKIRDIHRGGHGKVTPLDIIVKSCNVGMAQVGIILPSRETYSCLKEWGFGIPTGIELGGEESGLINPPETWRGVTPANIAIGQGVAITPLQLVRAFSAIANGGLLLRPYLVERAFDARGRLVHEGKREVLARVLSPSTASWMQGALRNVVLKGTGVRVNSSLVEVAGKTGTAQVAKGGLYEKGRHVASFAGFWPFEDPRFVMIVVIGDPKEGGYQGGEVAAPIFRDVVDEIAVSRLEQM